MPQVNTMNVGDSADISGGEFNSSGGDHNRITINIRQGVQGDPDGSVHSSSASHQGQQNLRRDRTLDDIVTQEPSNGEDEERILEEQSGNAIYERQMSPKKHGFPLWVPQPNILACLTHRREGVMIGDVGRVTPYGAFDVLFNICKAAGPPSNPEELPDGFEPLVLKVNDIHQFQEYTSGSYIASSSVGKLSGLTFRCSSSEGAILTMPNGAFHADLRNISLFRDFAAENAESWYRFVNGPCGWELGNGDLRLVTGCDKTTSWGLAAYHNIQSRSHSSDSFGEALLTFRSMRDVDSDRVPHATYCWEHEGTAEVKAGPEFEVDEAMPNNRNRARNQCTFIRSHTITLSEAAWMRVQSTLVSALDARRALKPPQPESTSSSNFLTGVFSSLGILSPRRSTGSATMTDSYTRSPVIHPSKFIGNMLLQKHTHAKVAVVHEDHWSAVIGENEDRMPTGLELWKRIQENFDTVLNSKGTIYLSERSNPPQHAPQLSEELAHKPFGAYGKPGSSMLSIKTIVDSPRVLPLFSTTPPAAVHVSTAPPSPPAQSDGGPSPADNDKLALVLASSEAQNDDSQTIATNPASPPVDPYASIASQLRTPTTPTSATFYESTSVVHLTIPSDDQIDQPSYPLNADPQPTLSSPSLSMTSVPSSRPNNSLHSCSRAARPTVSGDDQIDQPSYPLKPTQNFFWSPNPNLFDADVNYGAAVQNRYDNDAWSYVPYTPPSDSLRGSPAYPETQSYSSSMPTFSLQSSKSPRHFYPSPPYPSPLTGTSFCSTSSLQVQPISQSKTQNTGSSFGSTSSVQVQHISQPKTQDPEKRLYSHHEQLNFFREVLTLPMRAGGPFVPQQMYKPHTNSDRMCYAEEIELEAPIYFSMGHPSEFGILLSDALHSRVKRLQNRDQLVFEGHGPSVSIRLEWPGYRQWSRQIPTKDFRSPPGPLTLAKLAKNVAKCVQRFIEERQHQSLEDESDTRWRVGAPNHIKLEDLILVSIHHVSLGSWQPHLRLNRQFPPPS